jgi:hypothetical protein
MRPSPTDDELMSMADTLEGHLESVHEREVTPLADLDNEVEGDARVPPCLWVEQLRVRQKELEDVRL